jgi:GNAT superfamily N-acetyltransferase
MASSWNMSSLPTNEIRLAFPRDQVKLLPLIEQYYEFDSLKFDGRRIASGLQRLLRSRTLGRVWMTETVAESEAVGYAILTYNYDLEFGGVQGIITDFFITEPYRDRGLGRRMIAAMAVLLFRGGRDVRFDLYWYFKRHRLG